VTRSRAEVDEIPWRILLVAGWVLLAVGGIDNLLLFVPSRFGDLAWEFGTASALFNGLPVPALGVALIAAGSIALERPAGVMTACLWSGIMTLVLLGATVFYLLNVPVALKATTEAGPRLALTNSMAKACVSALAYLTLHTYILYRTARFLRH
jgi:hypothetical protein